LLLFPLVLESPSTFSSNMHKQVLQAPTPTIRVYVDVCSEQGEPDEHVGVMRDRFLGIYTHMCVGRTISMRAHPEHEAYACGL
jgi:hypothetical protein